MTDQRIKDIVYVLTELKKDSSVPRNVKEKIESAIKILLEEDEASIKIHKALHELEEVADDVNLQPFTRTQLWNVVSLLEKVD
ncbi:UPF0147 family protein [Candidatus Woesearchaeota archaeon]|nr:UPF0147 family protein [Candidatus Woesearchaeota archaeon]